MRTDRIVARQERKRLLQLEKERKRLIKIYEKELNRSRQIIQKNTEVREMKEGIFNRFSVARRDRIIKAREQRDKARESRTVARKNRKEQALAEIAGRKAAKVQRIKLRNATRQKIKTKRVHKWDDFKYKVALFLATQPKKNT